MQKIAPAIDDKFYVSDKFKEKDDYIGPIANN